MLTADAISSVPPTWAGVCIALIGLATLIVTTLGNRSAKTHVADAKAAAIDAKETAAAAKQAVHEVAGQLVNNGGSTALDKIQAGQREVLEALNGHDVRLSRIEHTLAVKHFPLPPPVVSPPHLLPAPSIITPEL